MTAGDVLVVRGERPVAGGYTLARHDGAIVLVAGALPDEVVQVRVDRLQRGTAWATVTQVLEASADRVGEPNRCGGLVLAHARYARQLQLKQEIVADAFRRIARHPLESAVAIEPSPVEAYRMRARLHVSGTRVGFYREGTHQICDARSTAQLMPEAATVVEEIAERLSACPNTAGAIDLAENREATERVVHIEILPDAEASRLEGLTGLPGVTGVTWSHAGSPRVRVLDGDPFVRDRFSRGGHTWTLARRATSFFQANRFLVDALLDHAVGSLGPGPLVDLYAGVGLFSVAAAALGWTPIVAVEGEPLAAQDLRRNASDFRGRLDARHQSVEDYLRRHKGPRAHSILIDPPRTGLSRQALAALLEAEPPRLVYVSCDVATLARDVRSLAASGYRLSGLRAFDLFPNTAHVETVAVLDR